MQISVDGKSLAHDVALGEHANEREVNNALSWRQQGNSICRRYGRKEQLYNKEYLRRERTQEIPESTM